MNKHCNLKHTYLNTNIKNWTFLNMSLAESAKGVIKKKKKKYERKFHKGKDKNITVMTPTKQKTLV